MAESSSAPPRASHPDQSVTVDVRPAGVTARSGPSAAEPLGTTAVSPSASPWAIWCAVSGPTATVSAITCLSDRPGRKGRLQRPAAGPPLAERKPDQAVRGVLGHDLEQHRNPSNPHVQRQLARGGRDRRSAGARPSRRRGGSRSRPARGSRSPTASGASRSPPQAGRARSARAPTCRRPGTLAVRRRTG